MRAARPALAFALLAGAAMPAARAQESLPQAAAPAAQPAPLPPALPAPRDTPWPGTIGLAVDARDLARHIFWVEETIPVAAPGPLTLLYPKWLPGNHGPTGQVANLAGLRITANGTPLAWRRDPVDMFAFHVDVPQGARALALSFQFLSPAESRDGRVVLTPNMLDVQWRPQILYPAGVFARDITVAARVRLPDQWQFGTALEQDGARDGAVAFKPVDLDTLLDSPLYAGRYFSRIDLDPHGPAPVHMDVVADRPEDLAISPQDLQAHRNQQAYRNFASRHYDHYDLLLSLSSDMDGIGLEHHRSSENGTPEYYFTDREKSAGMRDLLAHEYTHSWNGKFRRPADLWTPDFTVVPMRDSLLWVYEGQTEYWGQVLAARAGMMTAAQARDLLAIEAAALNDATPGRAWRDLQDTTDDPIISWHKPSAWASWSRFGDYYPEGALLWLDADTLIREKSHGAKSLTDVARRFLGRDSGSWQVETYTFDDVVAALNAVQPYDWAQFLRARLDGHGPGAPLDGLTRGGWRLVYTNTPNALEKSQARRGPEFLYSLGLALGKDNIVGGVLWNGPAFRAGLARGVQILAVDGVEMDGADSLTAAITAAQAGKAPIALLVKDGRYYRTVSIDYHGGLRYPHLERIPGTPDRLADILAPL